MVPATKKKKKMKQATTPNVGSMMKAKKGASGGGMQGAYKNARKSLGY